MKIIKILKFVGLIFWLTLKMNFYFLFSNEKKIGSLLQKYNELDYSNYFGNNSNISKIKKDIKKIDLIINYLPLKKTCLIRSLVKKEYFKINNIFIRIMIGVKKENDKMLAHAWIAPFYSPNENFMILQKI